MNPGSGARLPILAVVGPTASGKTSLALALAERLNTEIVSADSMQFYRGMAIGTAAPSPAELAQVRHHFVGFLDPSMEMAAGEYERRARAIVAELNARGKTAVVVGGSGLYVSALLDGLFPGPARHPEIREQLKAEAAERGNAHLYARLQAVDPVYAASLTSENDLIRIVRALEVYEVTGTPFSALHREHQAQAEPIEAVQVALDWDRELLYARINRRVDAMVAAGWAEEVRELIAAGYERHIHRLKALGFREMAAHLHGRQSLEEAVEATQQHHRRYAKRQLTWFRADKRLHWLPAGPQTDSKALAEAVLRQRCEMRDSSR